MPPATTEALGIHLSDAIIKSGLEAAIADMRSHPEFVEWALASLTRDPLLRDLYGDKELDQAKQWFQRTNIKVLLNVAKKDTPPFPCYTLHILSSTEVPEEGTLGDTHSLPFEDNDDQWVTLAGPATPTGYDAKKGVVTFNGPDLGGLILGPGMILLGRDGRQYPVLDVQDDAVAVVAPVPAGDMTDVLVKAARPGQLTELESTIYRESYAIGAHADSSAAQCIYLHALLIFMLLRYKQDFLEARGFERSVLDSQNLRLDQGDDGLQTLPQFLYSRYVRVTGYVRQYWPKSIAGKIQSVDVQVNDADTQLPIDDDSTSTTVAVQVRPGAPAQQSQVGYYGVGQVPASYNASFLNGLKSVTPAVGIDVFYTAGPGQYLYYAVPASFGLTAGSFVDDVTGFAVGVQLAASGLVFNGVSYDLWRSNQANLGTLGVRVRAEE